MASCAVKNELALDGVVSYILKHNSSGHPFIEPKWVSTRNVSTNRTGTGRAVRQVSGNDINKPKIGFEGDWIIEYVEPDGQLAVTAFFLNLQKNDQVR
jgi:hypothetical protein